MVVLSLEHPVAVSYREDLIDSQYGSSARKGLIQRVLLVCQLPKGLEMLFA